MAEQTKTIEKQKEHECSKPQTYRYTEDEVNAIMHFNADKRYTITE